MRKQYWLYGLILLGFIALSYFGKPPVNWTVTFDLDDENPFGTHALQQLLPSYLQQEEEAKIETVYLSFEELINQDYTGDMLVVCSQFNAGTRDVEALFDYVAKGNKVIVASNVFRGFLEDSLGLENRNYNIEHSLEAQQVGAAAMGTNKVDIDFAKGGAYPKRTYTFSTGAASMFLVDTNQQLSRLAYTFDEELMFGGMAIGKGELYLSTTPMLFTNYYLLRDKGDEFVAGLLSPLVGSNSLTYNQFYQFGRAEARTPLRYILSQPALRNAYILALVGVLLFVIFYGKRVQRIIPVIEPLKNSSLDFANTLGQLYYQQKNHENLAKKRLRYWLSFVRNHYLLETKVLDTNFEQELTAKSGAPAKSIKFLVYMAQTSEQEKTYSVAEMLLLEEHLNNFYKTTYTNKHGRSEQLR